MRNGIYICPPIVKNTYTRSGKQDVNVHSRKINVYARTMYIYVVTFICQECVCKSTYILVLDLRKECRYIYRKKKFP